MDYILSQYGHHVNQRISVKDNTVELKQSSNHQLKRLRLSHLCCKLLVASKSILSCAGDNQYEAQELKEDYPKQALPLIMKGL